VSKEMYEYKNVQVPVEAAEIINASYEKMKKLNPKLRKADLWLQAARKVKK